jgi:hypothetical protein
VSQVSQDVRHYAYLVAMREVKEGGGYLSPGMTRR